jgi:hypothetical protein
MLSRRLGVGGARALAACPSLPAAVARLGRTPYRRELREGDDLERTQGAVAATLLWHLRVLAGWQPRPGAVALRILAGWFEMADVVDHARALGGHQRVPPYRLGTLATAWPRLAAARSPDELRAGLARSPWRDPGAATAADMALGMQVAWAERVASGVPPAAGWAVAGTALLLARERFVSDREAAEPVRRRAERLLGSRAMAARSWDAYLAALPRPAGAALAELRAPCDLWLAENRWWNRVERDGFALLRGTGPAPTHRRGGPAGDVGGAVREEERRVGKEGDRRGM